MIKKFSCRAQHSFRPDASYCRNIDRLKQRHPGYPLPTQQAVVSTRVGDWAVPGPNRMITCRRCLSGPGNSGGREALPTAEPFCFSHPSDISVHVKQIERQRPKEVSRRFGSRASNSGQRRRPICATTRVWRNLLAVTQAHRSLRGKQLPTRLLGGPQQTIGGGRLQPSHCQTTE